MLLEASERKQWLPKLLYRNACKQRRPWEASSTILSSWQQQEIQRLGQISNCRIEVYWYHEPKQETAKTATIAAMLAAEHWIL
jgi:hypothetical protein